MRTPAPPGSATAAERFLSAWKRLEAELLRQWQPSHADERGADAAALLFWGERKHLLGADVADFLHSCRAAPNAYAHISFAGYDGPVTLPPAEVVYRLERIVGALTCPATAKSVAGRAVTCASTCSVADALRKMQAGDFSQLPYFESERRWLLVTRDQVCRWLEAEADEGGTVLADLHCEIGAVARHPRVGPVIPRVVDSDADVHTALAALQEALRTPDSEPGGYAAVLVRKPQLEDVPGLLTSDDLPRLYALLGR
jgi:hypothetical protein